MLTNENTQKKLGRTRFASSFLASFILLAAFLTGCPVESSGAQGKVADKEEIDKVLRIGYQKGNALSRF